MRSFSALQSRLRRVEARSPATSRSSLAERNARRLAMVASAPPAARDVVIDIAIRDAACIEEPADYHAFVSAFGAETINRLFPDGLPWQPGAFVRERVRRHFDSGETEGRGPIGEMIEGMIKRQHASNPLFDSLPTEAPAENVTRTRTTDTNPAPSGPQSKGSLTHAHSL